MYTMMTNKDTDTTLLLLVY